MKQLVQYISQGETVEKHLQNIENVCLAGGKWIQLRLKNINESTYIEAATRCKMICKRYDATLIINDNVLVAKESDADGVHLGLGDEDPKMARERLGKHKIIGGTANTLDDCIQHISDGVDYIGLGPFKYTSTKKKLSPILGIEGYHEILKRLKVQAYHIPIVAIGGITTNDIAPLWSTGISGIAISGFLSDSPEKVLRMRLQEITEQIKTA